MKNWVKRVALLVVACLLVTLFPSYGGVFEAIETPQAIITDV